MALQAIKRFRTREILSAFKDSTASPSVSPKDLAKVTNPFLPRLNPETGRWAPAKYSLRRQADLVKKAKESNTLHLLPAGPKFSTKELAAAVKAAPPQDAALAKPVLKKEEVWLRGVEWEGEVKEREVPGADVGNRLYAGKWRMFKGHKWQRTLEARKEKREKALKVMDRRIKWFKGVSLCSFCVWFGWWLRVLTMCVRTFCRCFDRRTSAGDRAPWTDQRLLQNLANFRSEDYVECILGPPLLSSYFYSTYCFQYYTRFTPIALLSYATTTRRVPYILPVRHYTFRLS